MTASNVKKTYTPYNQYLLKLCTITVIITR